MRTVLGCCLLPLLALVGLGACSGGDDEGGDVTTPEGTVDDHPTRAAVDVVADRIGGALTVLTPSDSGSTTSECTSGMGDFGNGEFASNRELEAVDGATTDILDDVIAAASDLRVVGDRALQAPVSGEATGRAVDLAGDVDGIMVSVAAVVEDGRLFIAVESNCV